VRILRILAQLLRQDLDLGDQTRDLLDQLGIASLQRRDPGFGVLFTLASWSPNRHINLRSRSDRGVDPPRAAESSRGLNDYALIVERLAAGHGQETDR